MIAVRITNVVAEAEKGVTSGAAVRSALIASLQEGRTYLLRFNGQVVTIDPDRFILLLCNEFAEPSAAS